MFPRFLGIFGWAMGMGPSKGFSSGEVQEIVTKKHDSTQNKIAKEDAQTATFAAGELIFITALYLNGLGY